MEISRKTRIFHVITKSNFGGAQRYVYDLATSLSPIEFEVTVVLGGGGALATKLTEKNIRVISIPEWDRNINLFSDVIVLKKLTTLFSHERPDVIHLNSSKAGFLGVLAGRMAGIKKIIFTDHGWAFTEDRSFVARMILKYIQWLTVILSTTTINVSQFSRDAMNIAGTKNKMRLIYNGIEPIHFKSRDEARQELAALGVRAPHNALWVGNLAELHNNKGLEYAILGLSEALSAVKIPLAYIICGEGEERANLEELIMKHHLENNVFLLGFVENAAQYLKAFDIFLFPSIKEGFPYALLEAGQGGLAVVASNTGGIPELILTDPHSEAETGILTSPKHASEIAGALKKLAHTQELRETLGAALHTKVVTQFTKDEMVAKTCALYK